ncbi:MAG TPA: alpha/beta hydrolase [Steroidobacteraceae bacterium]|nr:alpha/beta hydrolase [Steroidobacteraceae bacterium]
MSTSSLRVLTFLALLLCRVSALAAADAARCSAPEGTQPFEFTSGENRLSGFIDFPRGQGPYPAVLIIHGSGGTDVFNGSNDYNGHYVSLRNEFRSVGVATVVWDKPGSGCSQGGYSNGNPITERATETVAALRALKGRSGIDASRMGLWGISQGGWVAPMAAVRTADVKFLIVVSAPARDAVSQLEYQALTLLKNNGVPDAELKIAGSHLRRAFAIMRAGGPVEEFSAAVEPLQRYPALRELGITVGTPDDYRAWQSSVDYQYRPDTALRELQQPVLAIFGNQDVLIDWNESARIYSETFRASGNQDTTIKIFRNATHELKSPGSESYAKDYLSTMRAWLQKHTKVNR